MAQNERIKRLQQKKHKKRRMLTIIGVPLLVLLLATVSYAGFLYWKAMDTLNTMPNELENTEDVAEHDVAVGGKTTTKRDKGNISILFMGIDDSMSRNYNSATRTDALMLATFNKKDKSVKLLSIPRDTYTYINAEGKYDKINHAHVFGGVQGTVDAVESLLEIPVDYYVKMNFYAFIDVIDVLGGIDYEVPFEMHEKDTEDNHNAIHLNPGMQTLTGEEALALARTRKYDSDLERGKRQQEIMKTILAESASVGAITKYSQIIDAVGNNMSTNLKPNVVNSMFSFATGANIESLQLDGENARIDGVYYYKPDDTALATLSSSLQQHLGITLVDGSNTIAAEEVEDKE
ncbi:LytR family transcriptional regulator [Bacillus sp. HMF5848]|uniref:LCP family protein n=1 Tax=Bacillus sp. HMF5848 TaxID=2495421 RepID=UPI000F769E27|nr:LCP family protein [Bacillus sp. HMF5848]RSK28634.1 LytR family transcriptional regulator [Bacillus sp. HMF5848]